MKYKAQKESSIGPPFQVKENAIANEEIAKALKSIEERFKAAGLGSRIIYQWKPKRIVKEIMEQYTEFKSPFWKK